MFLFLKKDEGKYGEMFRFNESWVMNRYMSVFYSILCGLLFKLYTVLSGTPVNKLPVEKER